jgi:hypothetical protein
MVALPDLKANLLACEELNEASGNAVDAHTGGYTLTDVNAVGTAAGVMGTSRSFISAASQYLQSTNAAFGITGPMCISAWAYLTSTGSNRSVVSKYLINGSGTNYQLIYQSSSTTFRFLTYDAVGGISGLVTSSVTPMTLGV